MLLAVQRVELGQVEAGLVRLPLAAAVGQAQEVLAVGDVGAPAHAPHLQLAGVGGLQVLRPLGDLELDAHLQRIHVLLPELDELAVAAIGLGRVLEHQRAAVGQVAPAVAVLVDVAIQVQQRLGAGRVVLAHLGLEGLVVAGHARRDDALRRDRLALAGQPHLALDVHAQRDRAAQRDLLRRVAADDRVLHVEVGRRDVRALVADRPHAVLGEVGRELVLRDRHRREVLRQLVHEVEFLAQEGEPARLGFLDHRDLDPVHHRQLAALQLLDRLDQRGRAVRADLLVITHVAEVGVLLQHHARGAAPLGQAPGAGAHGVFHDAVAVGLDDLARDDAHHRIGEVVQEARIAVGHADLDRVAVQRAHTVDGARVVERGLVLQRLGAHLGQAQDLRALQAVEVAALVARVVVALDGVDQVLGHQLALLALERGIVGEVDAGLDLEDEALVVIEDLGQPVGDVGLEPVGPPQEAVAQRRVEDRRGHVARVQVGDLHRIETGLRHADRVAQHLGRGGGGLVGGAGGRRDHREHRQGREGCRK